MNNTLHFLATEDQSCYVQYPRGGNITEVKVNFGAGQAGLASWINVDIGTKYAVYKFLPIFRIVRRFDLISPEIVSWIEDSGRPPPNWKKWDITRKTPLLDGSVDYVYCSEVIEHFPRYEAKKVIDEAFRILKQGGIFRVTTPDVSLICKGYLSGSIDIEFFNSFFFWTNQRKKPSFLERIGERIYSSNPHLFLYDFESLREALRTAGFSDVVMCDMGKGRIPDLDLLEKHTAKEREFSMYVECTKK